VTDRVGRVYLVGAGPGHPGLITVRGLECIRAADCIVYDALVGRELLAEARQDAELCFVGKRGGHPSMPQDQINALLVEKALVHARVCRLKGGDPFVFGRGGEEALHLRAHGVPFDVVPGVTSAVAAPAYAGIPVTHRGLATSVAFITGHEDPAKEESSIDWARLACGVDTLVILMGVSRLRALVALLAENGRDPGTPVALVQWGTTPDQVTVTGTLETIADVAEAAQIGAPVAMVVGDVVSLRNQLAWAERYPLFGRRIVVTRARPQASELSRLIREQGGVAVEAPAIRIAAPDDFGPLDAAIDRLPSYHVAVFTSANGVDRFVQRLEHHQLDIRALAGIELVCIGPKTAEAFTRRGIRVSAVPETFVAEALVELLSARDLRGKRILLARAAEAREVLPDSLRAAGAEVDVVPAYRTIRDDTDITEVVELFESGCVDAVTFASAGTVSQFVGLLGEERARTYLGRTAVAVIGPITAQAVEALGLAAAIRARESTIESLVEAIAEYFAGKRRP